MEINMEWIDEGTGMIKGKNGGKERWNGRNGMKGMEWNKWIDHGINTMEWNGMKEWN